MRSTREVILVVFAVTIGASVFAALVGLLTIELVHPRTDTADGFGIIWDALALMLGGLVGYLLGRRAVNGR